MPPAKTLLALLSLACALALAPAAASAASVANTNDSGPGSLRQAVADAAPGETINVPAGTYTLTSGEITIAKSLTIAGAGAGATVIRGGSARAFGIDVPGDVTISGVTFREFQRSDEEIQGGVVFSRQAHLFLKGVVFTGNSFSAIRPDESGGSVRGGLVQSTFGSLTVLDSRFVGNTFDAGGASGGNGGVVAGGAILHLVNGTNGALTMVGTSISGNVVDVRGGQGPAATPQEGGTSQGGVLLAAGPATIRSSTVGGNTVDARGGPGAKGGFALGGVVFLTGTISLTEATIASNAVRAGATGAAQGGAVFISSGENGVVSVLSSTIAANSIEAGDGFFGGNLFTSGRVEFANTAIAGGVGSTTSENCFMFGTVISKGFNLDSRDQCGFHGPGDIVNRDPQLGPLADNGGPTPTMLPAPTSPLVDQGAAFGLGADQRGLPRPIDFLLTPNAAGGDGSDIGAVELQPSNAFALGELKKNRKKGTAQLTVSLPAPVAGTLTLAGKGLKTRTVAVGANPTTTFVVATTGKAKKALRRKGKRKVAINVTYAPLGAGALTQTRMTKLVRKKPRPKGAKGKPSKTQR